MRGEHATTEELSALLDDALTEEERLVVEAHLASCAACAAELDHLRSVVAMLHVLPDVRLPRSFAIPATQRLAAEPRFVRAAALPILRPVWLRALSGVAAAMVVVLLAFDASSSSSTFSTSARVALPAASQAAPVTVGTTGSDQSARGAAPGADQAVPFSAAAPAPRAAPQAGNATGAAVEPSPAAQAGPQPSVASPGILPTAQLGPGPPQAQAGGVERVGTISPLASPASNPPARALGPTPGQLAASGFAAIAIVLLLISFRARAAR
ncbi:MAG: hypothetical protein QOF51_2251 [Chloroflexota bacterium]|nr:hypothetical protein [Chloroflexota bacterium]